MRKQVSEFGCISIHRPKLWINTDRCSRSIENWQRGAILMAHKVWQCRPKILLWFFFVSFSVQHVRSSQIIPVSNCLPGKRCEREKGSPKLSPWNITVVRVAGVYSASATKNCAFPKITSIKPLARLDLEVVITLWTRFHVLTLGASGCRMYKKQKGSILPTPLKAVTLRFLLALKGGTALMILKIDCDVYLFYDSRVNETFCHLIEPQGTFTSLG